MMKISPADTRKFRRLIYTFFREHRRSFAWRDTNDPYAIFVSEIMLQQTQTSRVVPKFESFLRRFPSFERLHRARIDSVLHEWSGLGYNRRALALKRAAEVICRDHHGTLPSSRDALLALPGIGEYTAGALEAFVFGRPAIVIETNIRAVFVDYFFKDQATVADSEILPLIAATVDQSDPKRWYYALMDYGAELKRRNRELTRRGAAYRPQSPFRGSRRQVRGAILRALLQKRTALSIEALSECCDRPQSVVAPIISELVREEFLVKIRGQFMLARTRGKAPRLTGKAERIN